MGVGQQHGVQRRVDRRQRLPGLAEQLLPPAGPAEKRGTAEAGDVPDAAFVRVDRHRHSHRRRHPRTGRVERRAEIALQLQLMAELGTAKWTAIEKAGCGKELALFIIEEHQITFRPKKTLKDVADAFCGVAV